jgi:hypothetical protein
VQRDDGVVVAERPAAVDDFLAAALHLGVVALDRREVQGFRGVPARHRRSRAAAQADQHRRPAEHDHQVAGAEPALRDVPRADVAEPARQHDRLVVAARQAGPGCVLEGAEVSEQRGPAELVVERGRAERPVAHDLERAREARRQRAGALPRAVPGRECAGARR